VKKQIIVTTSWDDGHKLDLKLAKLLKKYGIRGTFYIAPKNREFKAEELLSDKEVIKLNRDFEIGAHTMTHPRLTKVNDRQAFKEITESKRYLENLTKKKVESFCYPGGKYDQKIKKIVKRLGFCYARTTKRFWFRFPNDLFFSGVSLEAYRNSIPAFPIDSLKILNISRFKPIEFLKSLHWEYLAKKMFDYVYTNGGVYHLWGHSWVIERNNDWGKIERIFCYIGKRADVKYVTNSELVKTYKMKILHVTKKYPNIMAGDSTMVASLEKFQRKMGNQVFILTSNCDEIIKSSIITKFGLKIKAFSLDRINVNRIISVIILFFYSFVYLRKIKPDVVHSHSPDLGFILSFACRVYKIPIINTCHGITFPDKRYSLFKRKAEELFLKYGNFKKIIAVDINSFNDLRKLKINNVVYLPNCVDLDQFNKIRYKRDKKIIFLFVGRIEIDKGLLYLIHAVKKLKNINKNFEVWLIGAGLNQNYFKKLVVGLNLSRYIKFLGKKNRDETIDCFYKSDVFILPSLHEGFPLTLLEAWAAELPVIITNVGGISKICEDKVNALIVPPKNPEAIAEKMLELIKDNKLRGKLGKNGKKIVEEKYSLEKVVKKILSVYLG